jgi:ABC-type dipeptide/oligopeptide/nickel transport system ATPase component
MSFKKAIKQESKLRLAITGPSGAGKTFTALKIATALTDKPIAVVDTEHGSASKYADLFEFDVMELEPPFHPDRYIAAIAEAQIAGYGAIIIDSLSHAWFGTGGLLDIVDEIAARSKTKNSFAAWKEGTPIHNRLIDGIIYSDIHVIATMRSKQDYQVDKDEDGKTKVTKLGLAPIQREGFEYEFDVVLDMDLAHTGIITKTRCIDLTDAVIKKPGEELAVTLREWLAGSPVLMSLEEAKAIKSPGGNTLGSLTDDQLVTLTKAINGKVTREMRRAAKVILNAHEATSERAGQLETPTAA